MDYGKSGFGLWKVGERSFVFKKKAAGKLNVKYFHNTHKQMYITDITVITVNSYENASPTPLPKNSALEHYDK